MPRLLQWIFIALAVVVVGFTIYYGISCASAEGCSHGAKNISRFFIGIMRFFH
ncbi:MAG: hypothetical protein HYS18_07940 [Burkholderiales bacterium]|nr:hypothetical protein [Burkholderiales bacterium]